jgi:hypothetical protein
MNELDQEAWDRWVAFRKAIRKPIKPVSEQAMKIKLQRYGTDQAAVVDQSIANQWQGLFDLKKEKPAPGEKPQKSTMQVAADQVRFTQDSDRAASEWNKHGVADSLGKLRLVEATLARYQMRSEEHGHLERMEWLRERAGQLLRDVAPRDALGDLRILCMVRSLFGERGVTRLRERSRG